MISTAVIVRRACSTPRPKKAGPAAPVPTLGGLSAECNGVSSGYDGWMGWKGTDPRTFMFAENHTKNI